MKLVIIGGPERSVSTSSFETASAPVRIRARWSPTRVPGTSVPPSACAR